MAADPRLIHAIRGPVTLITLGVLFTLDHFTPYGFNQTWPVLLIVFGLLSLLRRSAAAGPMPPPPGAPPWGQASGIPTWAVPPDPPPPPPPGGFQTSGGYRSSTYGTTSPTSGAGQTGPEGGSQ